MRKEILDIINAILEAERAAQLREDQLLIESDMDSFSYAVFWLTLAEHGFDMSDTWIDTLDYKTLTVAMIIDKIEEHQNGTV